MDLGFEPVDDDEWILRRIPDSQLDNAQRPQPVVFRPSPDRDADGLSFTRVKYATAAQVATAGQRAAMFVAKLSARAVRAQGVRVEPDPRSDNTGHCLVPEMCAATKGSTRVRELQKFMADTCEVLGPFR